MSLVAIVGRRNAAQARLPTQGRAAPSPQIQAVPEQLARFLRVRLVTEMRSATASACQAAAFVPNGEATAAHPAPQVLTTNYPFNGTFRGRVLSRTKQSQWPRLATPEV